jgi:hypothetical protein
LLAAWKGKTLLNEARHIMADDSRQFLSSQLVRLETLPKPAFEKQRAESQFYRDFFADVESIEPMSFDLACEAETLACKYGLSGSDALHIAAAIRQKADEFFTAEKPGKAMFRVKEIKVVSLYSLQS